MHGECVDEPSASTSLSSRGPENTNDERSDNPNNESLEHLQTQEQQSSVTNVAHQQLEQIFWSKSTNAEEKTREEEFDEYLADLLL